LLDKNYKLEPSEQLREFNAVLVKFFDFVDTVFLSRPVVDSAQKNQMDTVGFAFGSGPEPTKLDFSDEELESGEFLSGGDGRLSERQARYYKQLIEQKEELGCTNGLLKTQILSYEKKLKLADLRVEKLNMNYEDAMRQFEKKMAAQGNCFEIELLASEATTEKLKN
jgi:hypothetical protein